MKEILKKKTVKTGVAVIILAVAIGIISINARSAQRQREYDGHVEAAEKYLTDLDYEQAIVEYTLALEIEPNNEELLNTLEQTYLDYAQSLVDAGEYEKAVSVLEEGYAQTGRESLRTEIEEIYVQIAEEQVRIEEEQRIKEVDQRIERKENDNEIIEMPFTIDEIKFMGYSLTENHFDEISIALHCPVQAHGKTQLYNRANNEYGKIWSSDEINSGEKDKDYTQDISITNGNIHIGYIFIAEESTVQTTSEIRLEISNRNNEDYDWGAAIDSPVLPGDTYEDWCCVMQVESFREQMDEGRASLRTNWFHGNASGSNETFYHEYSNADGDLNCSIGSSGRGEFTIGAKFRDGILVKLEIRVFL